jgi:hypothetical protein
VLGQSGDAVFEKHYQSQFIARDLQHVVLLRPSQEGLVRFAGSMLRKRDLSAPSDLTEAHKRAICQNPGILQLRREKRELMAEMRSVAGTVKSARDTFPHLFQRHETVKKDLAKLRKTLAIETRETARKDYFNNAPVLEVDRQIKQMLIGESDVEERDADSSAEEDWELPIPDYVFPERARLVENFYGPDAEDFHVDKLLTRRIQVTKDMVALLLLCEPSRRGNRVNWDLDEEEKMPIEQPEQLASDDDTQICPTDVCIICFGESRRSASNPPPHKFPSKRPDSLRRHLIDSHLLHAHDGISCNWEACRTLPKFAKSTEFLAHANKEHKYDINIKLCHLTERPRVCHGDGSSRETSMESVDRQGTETPASSVDFDMTKIDPRLMRPGPITVVKPSACPSKPDIPASSSGCPVTTTDSNSAEISARRVTRGAAKAANIEPGPKLESSSQHATRSSRKIRRPEEQPGGQQKGKGRPGKSKASSNRYMPRRSKRLRAQ